MNLPVLTIDAARLLLLAVQGLAQPPARPAEKQDVLDTIHRMGALQIDTIHVVARSPYLVLFSRLGGYDPTWLDELLNEGRLFEYWAHAACFLPIEDYSLYVSRMENLFQRYYSPEWIQNHQETIDRVLQRIREEGSVRSADFERADGRKGLWWDWKEEKQVLEYLHTCGILMIARREKFQRVYDLRERVLPAWNAKPAPPLEEAQDRLAEGAVRALGAAPARWVPDYFRLPKTGMVRRLDRMADEGRLLRVTVTGWDAPWYVHQQNIGLLEQAAAGEIRPTRTTLLSPFDPIVWDRERARALFGFDYSLECYLPQPKRTYGYFVLPILHHGRLVGRLDAKAHRKEGIFEVRALYLEPGVPMEADLVEALQGALQRCADWHATPQVVIRRTEPEVFAQMLSSGEAPPSLQTDGDDLQSLEDLF
jgi:uncharacterized protein YcaQ